MRDDRPRRGDRELLACDLEDECSERIERRELVDPSAGAEVRSRVDQSREHRIRVAQELSRIGIGKGGPLAGSGLNDALGHRTFIPPSTTTSIPVTYKLSSEARKRATFASLPVFRGGPRASCRASLGPHPPPPSSRCARVAPLSIAAGSRSIKFELSRVCATRRFVHLVPGLCRCR